MRRACALALLVAVAGTLLAAEEQNLVPNANFDLSGKTRTKIPNWTEVDGLTTFFVKEPGRGRVLLIDTDVKLTEADARWKEMELPADKRPAAKPKGKTTPPKYDTVGGTTGAKIYSDYIRIEPGMRYRMTVDVKSDAPTVMIFVKGYAKFEGGFRKFYQAYENVTVAGVGWKRHERTFNPTFRSPKVTHIRVMPYAYWPPGKAWVDNIRISRVGKEKPPAATSVDSLLANGTFEAKKLAPWTITKGAMLVKRGSEGNCVLIGPKSALESPLVRIESDREYLVKARVLPGKAVVKITVEGCLKFGGKWTALFTKEEKVPPESEDGVDVQVRFHPTEDTPQVSAVRVRFEIIGDKGTAYIDDVSIEAAPNKAKPPAK